MKGLAVLALVLLALPVLGQAQQNDSLSFYDGKVQEIATFTLEFAQKFEHKPTLLRGSSKAETKLFSTASLQLEEASAEVLLRNQPYQEDLDNLERESTVNFVQLQTDAGEAYVLVTFGDRGGERPDLNPISVTRAFQDALLMALDAKFKRRKQEA